MSGGYARIGLETPTGPSLKAWVDGSKNSGSGRAQCFYITQPLVCTTENYKFTENRHTVLKTEIALFW